MKPYVVRRIGGGDVAAVLWIAAVVAFMIWLGIGFAVWLVVLVVLAGALRAWRGSERFRAGPDGIRFPLRNDGGSALRFAHAPWSSVDEVLVVPALAGPPEVAVRLRPDAPLPEGVRGIVRDPHATEGPIPDALRHVVPGLDPARLREAVAAFAPDVRLSETAGG